MASWGHRSQQSQSYQPAVGSQIPEGAITYTETKDADGRVIYHPFKAVPATYQTPQGLINGMQWIPADATRILPTGAVPASRDFSERWLSKQKDQKDHEKRQHEEEKRRRKEEKEAAKHIQEQRYDEELRRARERDEEFSRAKERRKSFNAGPGGFVPPGSVPYDGYSPGASDLDRRFNDMTLDRERRWERERGASVNATAPMGRPRTASFNAGPGPGYPPSYSSRESHISGRASPNPYGPSTPGVPFIPPSPSRGMSEPFPRSNTPYIPPGATVYPRGHVLEGKPIPRSRAPSPEPGLANYASSHYSAGPPMPGAISPLMFPSAPLQPQQVLEPPVSFRRPVNTAHQFTPYETMKIQDMEDFLERLPRMPLVLQAHDVVPDDWNRCMEDLARAWSGTLPITDGGQSRRALRPSAVTRELIDAWNANFFLPRGVEVVLYKGRERRSGRMAGVIDLPSAVYNSTSLSSSSSSSSSSEDSDSAPSGDERRGPQPYGVYGRGPAADHIMNEAIEARRRRREKKAEKKRRRKEKKLRRKAKEREKTYALYLTSVQPEAYHGSHASPIAHGAHGANIPPRPLSRAGGW